MQPEFGKWTVLAIFINLECFRYDGLLFYNVHRCRSSRSMGTKAPPDKERNLFMSTKNQKVMKKGTDKRYKPVYTLENVLHVGQFQLCHLGELSKNPEYFMTNCQRVGRRQSQNISFPKEITKRGWLLESLDRKLKPWIIYYLLENTTPHPELLHLHLYFCICHQSIVPKAVCPKC